MVKCRLSRGVVLSCVGLIACGAEDPSSFPDAGTELGESSDALVNGKPPNGLGDGGTIRISIPVNGAWQAVCSGQIIARDAILTAGHCVRVFGRPPGNRWPVQIWRQKPDSTWVNHTQNANGAAMVGTIRVHPQYAGVQTSNGVDVNGNPILVWVNHSIPHDMAIIQLDTNLVGVDASDSTYLDNGPQLPRDAQFWGYSTGPLQQGPYRVSFDFGFGLYNSSPKVTDPRVCPGDSGGPLKRAESLFERDGIQIALASTFSQNMNNCLGAGAVTSFTAIQPNMSFITGALPGRCVDVAGLPTVGAVQVKRCW